MLKPRQTRINPMRILTLSLVISIRIWYQTSQSKSRSDIERLQRNSYNETYLLQRYLKQNLSGLLN